MARCECEHIFRGGKFGLLYCLDFDFILLSTRNTLSLQLLLKFIREFKTHGIHYECLLFCLARIQSIYERRFAEEKIEVCNTGHYPSMRHMHR